LAISIGKKFNISPKKIDYVLKQYSGGIGQLTMPLMTKEAERNPITSSFTIDTVFTNKATQDFFSKKEELTAKAKDVKPKEKDVLGAKYFNIINAKTNDLYKEKRDIQMSKLPDKEKMKQSREIQTDINKIMNSALLKYKNIENKDGYKVIGSIWFKQRYNKDKKEYEWIKAFEEK
jgi:hypothetical protein